MEDGFSSYSSLYDTSSLLQFCNGERGRADEGTGTERRGPGRAAGEAAPSSPGSRRRIVLGPRAAPLPGCGLPDAHPRAPGAGGSVAPGAPADAAIESARGSPGTGRPE